MVVHLSERTHAHHTMFAILRLAICFAAILVLVACNGSGEEPQTVAPSAAPTSSPTPIETPSEEKVLTILYWQAPSLPGPFLSSRFKDRDAGAVTLEPLAKYTPDGDLTPALAVEIPTLENGGVSP